MNLALPLDIVDRPCIGLPRAAGQGRSAVAGVPMPVPLVRTPTEIAAPDAPVRSPASVRRSRSACPYPLRVVVLAQHAPDADALLAPSPMVTVQAELAMTPRAIRDLVMLGPDVAIVDLRGVACRDVAAQLRRVHGASRRTRIVAVVPDDAAVAHEALLGGATACVPVSADGVAMLRAVHDAARDRLHLGGIARHVLRDAAAAC